MEIVRAVLEFTKVLVWPMITLILALLFQDSIRELLRRITKGTLPGGIGFEAHDAQHLALAEQKQRLELEVAQAATSLSSDARRQDADKPTQLAQQVELAETLVLKDIELEYGGNLRRQVYLHGSTFDAVTWTGRGVTAVEVKVVGTIIDAAVFEALFEKAEAVSVKYQRNVFSFVLAIVTINQSPEVREGLRHRVATLKRDASVQIDVRSYDLLELQRRYGIAAAEA